MSVSCKSSSFRRQPEYKKRMIQFQLLNYIVAQYSNIKLSGQCQHKTSANPSRKWKLFSINKLDFSRVHTYSEVVRPPPIAHTCSFFVKGNHLLKLAFVQGQPTFKSNSAFSVFLSSVKQVCLHSIIILHCILLLLNKMGSIGIFFTGPIYSVSQFGITSYEFLCLLNL